MIKTIMVTGALALGLIAASPAGPASAGMRTDIGIGLNGGGYDRDPYYWPVRRGISCRDGVQIVYSAGFRNVRPNDCNGSEYTYVGRRHDRMYKITVSSRSGNIKNVERLRRGGGWGGGGGYGGGYGDDGGYDDGGGYGDDYNDGDY